mgnify:CR=1 FL=1
MSPNRFIFYFLLFKILVSFKNRLDTLMLRVHFKYIKTPRTLDALAPFGILIVKNLKRMYSNYYIDMTICTNRLDSGVIFDINSICVCNLMYV